MYVVADGMGGHLAGDVASATAVEIIKGKATDGGGAGALESYVKEANNAIWNKAHADAHLQGMGTTCTLLYLDGSTAHIAHVGDSRAYLLRDGSFSQITEDHTLVQRMVNEGRLRQEEAAHHPQRSIITRALGVDADVEVDITSIEVTPGDRILMCSDGLTSMVDDPTIQELLGAGDVQGVADKLVDAANEAGGEDNITVVVVDISDGSAPPAPASTPTRSDTEPRDGRVDSEMDRGPRPARAEAYGDETETRGGWGRRIVVVFLILVLLGGAGYAALRYTLDRSWYVGTTEEGTVAIFSGIPEEVAGLTLSQLAEESTLTVDELPQFAQEDVRTGIKVDSLEEGRTTLEDLEERSADFSEQGSTKDG
jgi:protein phosphatase